MRFAVTLLLLLSALTFAVSLGQPAITDSDEAYYAESAREMVESGDWLTPHFNYTERFQKPVLFYWVIATFYSVGGVNEAAARLGAACAGLGLVLIAFACGRRWYDEPTGVLAGAIVATSFGCVALARASLPDLPLAFFITATTWAGFVALFDRNRRSRRWWVLAGAAAGAAFLTKGPVGVVIPVLVLAVPFYFERGWRRVHLTDLLLAFAVFVAVAAPWYVAMALTHGRRYIEGFFLGDNLERFATSRFNDPRPFYYYVPIVLGGMLPWSAYFGLSVRPAWRLVRRREKLPAVDLRVLCWALLPLLLFTASVGKQPRYIMPALPALALWLAVTIRRSITTLPPLPHAQPALFRVLTAVTGVLVAGLGVLLLRARPLLFEIPSGRVTVGIAALVLTGLALLVVAASRSWKRAPAAVTVAGVVVVLALQFSAVRIPGPDPVERMATSVMAHRQAGEPVAPYKVFTRNLVYYTHVEYTDLYSNEEQLFEYLSRPDRVLLVLPEGELQRLEASGRFPLRRLAAISYFDAATAKPRTLLWPDVSRDLRTTVLVANR